MQTMKEVLVSIKGKKLDVTFDNGLVDITVRAAGGQGQGPAAYPCYVIEEVGADVFKMVHKGSVKAGGTSRYYPIDRVFAVKPATS